MIDILKEISVKSEYVERIQKRILIIINQNKSKVEDTLCHVVV